MKILIGYDGSECATAAAYDLRRAGLPADAEAVVMAIADLPVEVPYAWYGSQGEYAIAPPPVVIQQARARAAEAMEEARQHAAGGADLVASACPGWHVRAEAESGSPYWSLVRKAEQWGADLIVVGSHGRSMLGRLFLGSVSQVVLSHAPCSVRVGRCRDGKASTSGESRPPPKAPRLIVAVDGSEDSDAAVRAVAARTWPAGTEVRAVTVADLKLVSTLAWPGSRLESDVPDVASLIRGRAALAAQALRGAGLAAEPVVLDGDPKHALLEEAERWGADCVFLGAKGHSALERFTLGSVSAAVAARAHCSVEVVRRA